MILDFSKNPAWAQRIEVDNKVLIFVTAQLMIDISDTYVSAKIKVQTSDHFLHGVNRQTNFDEKTKYNVVFICCSEAPAPLPRHFTDADTRQETTRICLKQAKLTIPTDDSDADNIRKFEYESQLIEIA